MHGLNARDGGRTIDWSGASYDYAKYRPPYPASFHSRLAALGVGNAGQRILDLGTGVGFLARQFARQGARVVGIDVAEGQIVEARRQAEDEELSVDFRAIAAEDVDFPDGTFDVVSAGQCWLYFDRSRLVPKLKRWLAPGGRLVTAHFSWVPRLDEIAAASERLVLRHNPDWSAADWSGEVPVVPSWAGEDFRVTAFFYYDEPIPFTRERWRGRIRACRGVGATLAPEEVERFDREHARLLETIAPDQFEIIHRIDAHVLGPLSAAEGGR